MAIWSRLVSGKANKKHSGCSSEDVDVEQATVIPVISAPAENQSQLLSSSPLRTESSQATSTSDEKAKPTPKQDDLRKKIETSLLQLFVVKALTFDVPQFTYHLFLEMSIQ